MGPRAALAAAAATTACTLAATQPATAATHTIRWSGDRITHVGALRTTANPTIARAQRVFGTPSSKRLPERVVCLVDWSRIGLRAYFVNLGRAPAGTTTCSPNVGKLQSATVSGRDFRTQRGLRVGDTTARLRRLHPGARFRNGAWELATRPAISGEPGLREALVRAHAMDGKVASITFYVGAAGE